MPEQHLPPFIPPRGGEDSTPEQHLPPMGGDSMPEHLPPNGGD